jgi:hypothetical protein
VSFVRLWVGVENPCLIKLTLHDPALDETHDHEARRGVGLGDECMIAERFQFAVWPEHYANSFWASGGLHAVLARLSQLEAPIRLTLDLRRAILDLPAEATSATAEGHLGLLVDFAQLVDAMRKVEIIPAPMPA